MLPYVPKLLSAWSPTGTDPRHMRVPGSLAFVDISGFTALTERLARQGKVGAEQMSDVLSETFSALLGDARSDGADLVKWGGDAVLLLFRSEDHAERAARAAHRMRATLRTLSSPAGSLRLRMSVGVHSGDFDFFLVGDPAQHRELIVSGPAASITAETEAAAQAGQIGLSAATAAVLPPRLLGAPLQNGPSLGGRLLRSAPDLSDLRVPQQRARVLGPAEVLPGPIRSHLLAGTPDPEHRLITVAFVQFGGTDALMETSGPDAVADALDHLVRTVQSACEEHAVTFFESDINRDGGKIMLTAGAPASADHDEERMLRLARRVLDNHRGPLSVRIGINRGRVFAGDFGPPFRRTYSVKGDAINLAARVMAKAGRGEALATTEVLAHAQSRFEVTHLPPFMVKGKSRPVHAASLGRLLGTRTAEQVAVPLVGRALEMAVLREAMAAVRTGRGRLVQVLGEAGIGKSRLVAELVAEAADATVLHAPCEEYESSTAYYPFRLLFRTLLGIGAETPPAEVSQRLHEVSQSRAPHLLPWLPLLGLVLDVPLPPTREVAELEEQFRRRRLEAVVGELLGTVLTTPTIVVVEDAHRMDEPSSALLGRLVEGLGGRPWLVLATRRDRADGFVPPAVDWVTTLRPPPLGEEASRDFVTSALDDLPLTPTAMEALARRAGGNPLFLEALVLEATRSGTATPATDLPESVEALVTSQIDRLPPGDRTILRCAAVLGTAVDETALELVSEGRADAASVRRLSPLLVRDAGSGLLRFRNDLIRDVAYEGLPFSRRRHLHEQVGLAIEQGSASPESHCEVLSLHFFHAGRHDRAWRYSVLAGERARAKFAQAEAAEFFSRAARAAARTSTVTDVELAKVLERLADCRFLTGQLAEAREAYAAARRRAEPVRVAKILEKEARIDHRHRKYSLAMRRISRGLRALDELDDPAALVARSLLQRRYAYSLFNQGRVDEALRWADAAATAAEDAIDPDALAQAYEMLNAIHAGTGREEPLPYGRLALQAYVELDNLPRQGHCLNNLAVQAFAAGRWADAAADYRRASDIFRRIGDTASEGNARYNLCELLVRQRHAAEAEQLLPDVLRSARAVEDDELVALVRREQGRAAGLTGDVERATKLLAEAEERFAVLEEDAEVHATRLARAEVLLDAGPPEQAAAMLEVPDAPAAEDEAVDCRLLGRLYAARGDTARARDLLVRARALAGAAGDGYEEGLALMSLGALDQGPAGAALLEEGSRLLRAMGVVLAPVARDPALSPR